MMTGGLRPYADMRPTSLEWLPELPTKWELHRAKYSFREVDERSATGDEELLSVSHKTGVTPRSEKNVTMFMAESNIGHKLCRPGDIAINTMWAWMAALGVSCHVGLVSPSYGVYRPRPTSQFEPRYLDYLLRTEAYRAEYVRRSRGITTSRLRLYPPDFLRIPLVQPPRDEQRLIVRFLDWNGNQTMKLTRAKRRVIALLNEQKQAIINEAVTRGLDSHRPFKSTGVAALPEIPIDWEMRPLKYWLRQRAAMLGETTDRDYEFDYLDISCVGTGFLTNQPRRIRFENAPSRARQIVKRGDTLISTVRTYLKAVYFVEEEWPDLIASTGFAVLRPVDSVHPKLLGYILQSSSFIERVIQNSIGVAYPAISETRLGTIHVAVPRDTNEQQQLLGFIRENTLSLEKAIRQAQKQIALVQEYRERVIADVTVGKLDVRGAAASLPEQTAEAEPLDEHDGAQWRDEGVGDDYELEEAAA